MPHPATGFNFPDVSPIAFSLGIFHVHWYALAYVFSFLFAWSYSKFLLKKSALWPRSRTPFPPVLIEDLLVYACLGVLVGGRLGYVLFYNPASYLHQPLKFFMLWEGGMSFHGGLIGVLIGCFLFSYRYKIKILTILDLAAVCVPFGLFLGRIANFFNAELWGRVTTRPWGVKFPTGGTGLDGSYLTRHPSQLYEAALEGLLLFLILFLATFRFKILKRPGLATSIFGAGYACARIFVEFYREPDAQLGYLWQDWLTMGMLLSLPMLLISVILFYAVINREP